MDRLNIFAPHVRANPYPHYAELRRAAPVAQIEPGGLWAVSRYDDIVSILKTPSVFSSQGLRAMTVQPWLERNPTSDSVVVMDPPLHTKSRALVAHAFSARVIPRIEPLARAVCTAFAARAREGVEMDICDELSSTLPAAVIANLLGLDGGMVERFRVWSEDLVAINPGTPEAAQPRIRETITELDRYLNEVLAARRLARRDDLVSDLLDAQIDGERLGDEEIVSFLFLLLIAGFETTTHLLTNSLRVLADHPELVERLRAEPAAIPRFVEEVLRFDSPVQGTMRLTLADVDVSGVRIPAGAVVLLLLGSANRDERQFERPDQFDIDRTPRTNLSFGHGIHFCIGAALARIEARIALEELIPQIRGVRVTREPTWNLAMTVRGPLTCRLKFLPA
ncbi:MAG: cytochrome P450 [Byssovorax sp.]